MSAKATWACAATGPGGRRVRPGAERSVIVGNWLLPGDFLERPELHTNPTA